MLLDYFKTKTAKQKKMRSFSCSKKKTTIEAVGQNLNSQAKEDCSAA